MRKTSHSRKLNVLAMTAINVPIALLQEVKDDRLEQSIVAMSVAIKCFSPSSTYIFVNERKFRRDFQMGYTKSMKLLDAIFKGHPLFEVKHLADGRTVIVARSFKRLYGYWMTLRTGETSLAMSVAKMDCRSRGNIRIAEIEKEIQLLLFLTNINAKTRADELQAKGLPLTGSSSHAARTVLSVNYLAKATSRSARTVVRRSRSAREQGIISVTPHPLVRCCNNLLHDDLRPRPSGIGRQTRGAQARASCIPALVRACGTARSGGRSRRVRSVPGSGARCSARVRQNARRRLREVKRG